MKNKKNLLKIKIVQKMHKQIFLNKEKNKQMHSVFKIDSI